MQLTSKGNYGAFSCCVCTEGGAGVHQNGNVCEKGEGMSEADPGLILGCRKILQKKKKLNLEMM